MMSILYLLATNSPISPGNLPTADTNSSQVDTIANIVFSIVGALALLMIVVSGLRYIASSGNPDRASKAKDGIIFALVGLMVAIAARAIVAFVAGSL